MKKPLFKNDIVDRLNDADGCNHELCYLAADEIEYLRDEIAKQIDQIEYLKLELEQQIGEAK